MKLFAILAVITVIVLALLAVSDAAHARTRNVTSDPTLTPTLAPPIPTPHPCESVTIKPPKRNAPMDGALISTLPFKLVWSQPQCAHKYQLHVVHLSPDRENVVRLANYPNNRYEIVDLPPGNYLWRVRGCFRERCGTPSQWWRFTILP